MHADSTPRLAVILSAAKDLAPAATFFDGFLAVRVIGMTLE